MNSMKFIGSLFGAIITYLIIGIIAWNLVCSFMIDIPSTSIIELANYRICTYSVVTLVLMFLFIPKCGTDLIEGLLFYGGVIAVNAAIAIGVNYWDTAWDNVIVILAWVYNIVNVMVIALTYYLAILEANS